MMKTKEGHGRIATDESLRERAHHGTEEYPFRYYLEDIWLFDFHCIDWHWHPEVELIYIEKGTADCYIGSGKYVLREGMGAFINAQVIHRFEASGSVIVPNIVFSPSLLASEESLLYRKYIQPMLASAKECVVFSNDVPKQSEMIDTLVSVFGVQESEGGCEIRTVELLLKLWHMIYENTDIAQQIAMPRESVRTQAQLQIMLQYIHKNYPYQISLDDIAGTVSLSKSSVLNIFHKNIHTSPVRYLVDYRLKRAAKRLASTQDSISAIAHDTGFENTGYFCRKFKESFRVTPSEYRNGQKEKGRDGKNARVKFL